LLAALAGEREAPLLLLPVAQAPATEKDRHGPFECFDPPNARRNVTGVEKGSKPELADGMSPEVTIDGEAWGDRRVTRATYTSVFGDIEIERATYQRSGRGRVAVPLELRLGIVEGRTRRVWHPS
jgi:hypothetical protein